jgi:predicted RNA-binding Zn ribbon-like protein
MQPGARAAAPGDLALVQAFINTHYDLVAEHGAEVLASPDRLRDWLASRGLISSRAKLTGSDLSRALAAREALRALAAGTPFDPAALEVRVELRITAQGPEWLSAGGGVAGRTGAIAGARAIGEPLATLLSIVAREMVAGRWRRLKVCPGDDCGWAFYDHSRNRTGRWCSMSVCGGRAKARAHYRRRIAAL